MIKIKNINLSSSKLESWLELALINQIGPKTVLKLLKHFNSVDNILSQNFTTLESIVGKFIANLICNRNSHVSVKDAIAWLSAQANRHILTLEDINYPRELLEIADPPVILFAEGNLSLLRANKIAIVGTRHPTNQGQENAVKFARDLSNSGFCVVSGVAAGIDRFAHIGALQGSSTTIGVIGTGMDINYPKSNIDIYKQILQSGLLLSEYPLGTMPLPSNFPRRNRIVAGLSLGLLVVESTIDGGSLISAHLALEMGREVMAIPGSIHNPVAKGCNKLIKSGAKLVETVNDIIEEIKPEFMVKFDNKVEMVVESDPDLILKNMGYEAINIDTICERTKTSFENICAKLLDLELSGKIVNCGNGYYQRIYN